MMCNCSSGVIDSCSKELKLLPFRAAYYPSLGSCPINSGNTLQTHLSAYNVHILSLINHRTVNYIRTFAGHLETLRFVSPSFFSWYPIFSICIQHCMESHCLPFSSLSRTLYSNHAELRITPKHHMLFYNFLSLPMCLIL